MCDYIFKNGRYTGLKCNEYPMYINLYTKEKYCRKCNTRNEFIKDNKYYDHESTCINIDDYTTKQCNNKSIYKGYCLSCILDI